MTLREKDALCQRIRKLHGYCKRRFDKALGRWVCEVCRINEVSRPRAEKPNVG